MNTNELLKSQLTICQIHADRLNLAIGKIAHLYPFNEKSISDLKDEDLGYFELFTTRLGKLQDTLGEKVFNYLLELLGEDTQQKSAIDKLNMLEKLNLLPSTSWWIDLRKLRNYLVHEYPDDPGLLADNLNKAYVQAKRLMLFYSSLVDHMKERQFI